MADQIYRDRSEYKISAIMMTVLNLPREVRFRKEWTIVLGVIPGPTEPKENINTFLKPIVDDLYFCGMECQLDQMAIL